MNVVSSGRSDAAALKLVIVHWNRPAECAAAIRSCRDQVPQLRILVVDNHSSTEMFEELLQQLSSSVEILRLDENKGWGPALNVALHKWLKQETTPYYLISAHDAEPGKNCLPRLLEAIDSDPKLGIVCPQYLDGSVPRLSALRGVSQKIVSPLPVGIVQNVDVPHGTLMLVRRQCLLEIGLFDERYFAYGDEHELGARARRRGWKVGLVWGATVENPHTSISSTWRSYLFTRNSLLLVHDYFGTLAAATRAVLILLKTIPLALIPPQNGFAFSARARWRGCRDYFRKRFGRPVME